jgi:hypothetical protein
MFQKPAGAKLQNVSGKHWSTRTDKSMVKYFVFILTLIMLVNCQTSTSVEKSNADSTIDTTKSEHFNITLKDITNSKYDLKGILFQDSWAYYKASKDTLLVFFEESGINCGNAPPPLQYISSRSLFDEIKTKALKYGFKTVLTDSIPFEEILLGSYDIDHLEKIAFYKIAICPITKNKVTIFQSYVSGKDKIDISKDTTITL